MGLLDRFLKGDGGAKSPADHAALRAITEGNALEDQGHHHEALQRYDEALRLAPTLARAHVNRGNALLGTGDANSAIEAYQQALALEPQSASAHYNLGNAFVAAGRLESALAAYREAIAANPTFVDAEVALGVAQESLGQLDDAIASYRRALTIAPRHAQTRLNLGNALHVAGRFDDSVAILQEALEINPRYTDAHRSLGRSYQAMGRLKEAMVSYRQALTIDPMSADAHADYGMIQQHMGLLEEALRSYRKAIEIDPNLVDAHSNAGAVLLRLGRFEEAIASQRRALAVRPDFAEAHFNLANVLRDGGRPLDAIASYRRALAVKPDLAHAHVGLGDVLKDLGEFDEAVENFRDALKIDPTLQEAYTSLLFCLSHDEHVDPETLYAEQRQFADRFETPLISAWPAHRNDRDPKRDLRIGVVSADLRAHPVSYFFEPVLRQLAKYPSLTLHAYANQVAEDGVSRRLREQFRHWNPVAHRSADSLARRIAADAIDILIDLSGHTNGNRLQVFARRPAPIQVSWMGYPGSTGLKAMDYYFADAQFLPFDEFRGQFTEKLVHLPASAPFLPEPYAPPVNALPALANGYVTFGSFNRPSKLRPQVIALWSRLLHALPEARLLLGAMPREGHYDRLIEGFVREGVARERLEFHVRSDVASYLKLHGRVDVCLDTFPYSGGTTTAHALWMGVPTLTLAGRTPAGRQGAAILGKVGLPEFVASDTDDYVRKAVALATDFEALAALRAGMRARCEEAPNGRPEVIAAAVERAFRIMWERWCAGLPPESFTVDRPKATG